MHEMLEEQLAAAGSVCYSFYYVNRPVSTKHSYGHTQLYDKQVWHL